MLEGEPDPAQHLDAGLRHRQRAVEDRRRGDVGGERPLLVVRAEGHGRHVPRGGRHRLGGLEHLRAQVLDRLEAADLLAELLAHLGVLARPSRGTTVRRPPPRRPPASRRYGGPAPRPAPGTPTPAVGSSTRTEPEPPAQVDPELGRHGDGGARVDRPGPRRVLEEHVGRGRDVPDDVGEPDRRPPRRPPGRRPPATPPAARRRRPDRAAGPAPARGRRPRGPRRTSSDGAASTAGGLGQADRGHARARRPPPHTSPKAAARPARRPGRAPARRATAAHLRRLSASSTCSSEIPMDMGNHLRLSRICARPMAIRHRAQ